MESNSCTSALTLTLAGKGHSPTALRVYARKDTGERGLLPEGDDVVLVDDEHSA